MKKLTTRVKNRYDSAYNWKSANPVLMEGEFGVDEYGRVKAGDGTTAWNSLPYVMDSFRLEPLYTSDYQDGIVYDSGFQTIKAGKIPAVILVRDGSIIPHVPLAQRTDQIDWSKIELKTYKADAKSCTGLLFKPGDADIQEINK